MTKLPCPICQEENDFTSTHFDVEETYERPIYVVTGGLHIVCPTCSRIFYVANRGGVLELEQRYPDRA